MTVPTSRLPSFVIIGAVKAATTWTGNQLRAQPNLFLPEQEPHYFSSAFDRGPGWYASLFAAAEPGQLVGEKSADYLAHPLAASRLASMIPDARLVVQLRNPIERAYSDYCMLYRRGTVDGRIDQYLTRGSAQPRFLNDGLYGQHLARFADRFPQEQLQIVLYDDVRRAPEATLEAIGRHIGTPTVPVPVAPDERRNDSRAPLLPLGLRRTLQPLKRTVAPFRRRAWFQRLHAGLARPIDYPQLRPDLRLRLRDFYAADVESLGTLLRRDLGSWLAVEQSR
ncbi:sulfotransferase family protein [Glacieibacterium sp.]|uniref:sulfotransferase family protein n=1 Tax=Glacieibacterium sp. TaxID=2860237 RepID=UPI003B0035F2